jgi:hypothetical protein
MVSYPVDRGCGGLTGSISNGIRRVVLEMGKVGLFVVESNVTCQQEVL